MNCIRKWVDFAPSNQQKKPTINKQIQNKFNGNGRFTCDNRNIIHEKFYQMKFNNCHFVADIYPNGKHVNAKIYT